MEQFINLDYNTLESMVRSFLWPLFRISGMMMSMVIIGSFIVSRIKRTLLAVIITTMVAPMLPPMPNVELFSVTSFIISVQQVLIGIAVGFISRMNRSRSVIRVCPIINSRRGASAAATA